MANATVTAFKAALDEHSIVTITDAVGKLNYVNDRFCALSKYSREELIGQDHRIVNSGHHSNVFFRDLWQRISDGRVWHGEIKNRAKDGSAFWVDTTIVPFIGADGDQSQYIAIRADITDRKRAEEAIEGFTSGLEVLVAQRTAEMRQALATLDATADGAFIFDPETLSFAYVNQGATRQLGYTCDELLVLTPLEIAPEFDEPRFRELLRPLLDGAKSVVNYTTRHRCKDGRLFPVEISLQLVTIDAGKPRFIAIARDITERLDHESKERRAQRIESIGTLAGGVAHDLNNALAPILMTCELMRMDFAASPEMSEMIETIESSARRGADMVRQLLTFAKGVEGERRLIQPLQLFDQMQKIVRSTFPKHVQLRTSVAPGLKTVLGDYTQLHQVLLNLCVNARDAMPNGGTLTLEAENVEIDAANVATIPGCRAGAHVVWRIIDTGSGIPPELLERIFEPFFSTKGQDGGTGLGLSTVSGIVRSHGGFIRVASTLGQGTTFSVHLPAETRTPAATELAAKIEPAFRGNNEMILVVDDEPAVRKVTSSVLMGLNFQVLTAADGTEALVKVAERRSELVAVVTDLHMPHMDGLTFVRALKRMLPTTGIIVTSGRLEKQDILSFKALGVTAMLDKPFTQAQLVAAVRAIVQK
jgi:two-component system cell cycle sensor histidine kinase/response regulator CckA